MKTYDLTGDRHKDAVNHMRDAIAALRVASIRLRQAGQHVRSLECEGVQAKLQQDLDYYIAEHFPIGGGHG